MSDIVDIANERAQHAINNTLANSQKFNKPSLTKCIDCDDDIPEERQKLGGVTRCIECQKAKEK